ncbi:polysaccharide ABC transporter ATP-binding protein [Paenibacillus sp. MY03]|jgi:putative aldouronate transport system permease protein|uniref:Sugar ABC transporter ATPase n=2 Tax=Paenibacillus TaxID=44249 RepID=A0A2R5EYH9_9BACL|nr:polysaccharide ABC transporter ATP-binding protein [Paenibacillus sp. MY03]GBG11175.1 sugar ABC transporter ATPase [Paenibacillus agaridevorans]
MEAKSRFKQSPQAQLVPLMKLQSMMRVIWRFRAFYIMLLPGVIYFIIFRYLPMYGVIIAFKDYAIMEGITGSPWINPWYKHFQTFYQSPYFSQLLSNTLLISIYKLVWGTLPPIIMAILLNECRVRWLKSIVQTLTYMPHFLSWVIIFGILLTLFSQNGGLINRWIVEAGGTSIPFLTSTDYFRSILVGSEVWQNLGWGAIIYLAAMSGIDPTLYEAAKVDGANRLRMIWHITLPGIRSIIVLLFILKLGHLLDAGFDQIYILYNIQVYPVADILDTWVYRTGLQQLNFSLASAVGLFKSVIGLVLVVIANQIAKKWGEAIW